MITLKNIEFVRYGGLSPVKQVQYDNKSEDFHNPPRKKGNYAFVHNYVDTFLISSSVHPGHISNKSQWVKDDNGNKIKYFDIFDKNGTYDFSTYQYPLKKEWINFLKTKNLKIKYLRDFNDYVIYLKPPKIFKYNGDIWHHLSDYLKPHQIIETKGSWVKTSMEDYIIAINLEIKNIIKQKHKFDIKYTKDINNIFKGRQDPFNPSIGISFIKDHLEVFIEKI